MGEAASAMETGDTHVPQWVATPQAGAAPWSASRRRSRVGIHLELAPASPAVRAAFARCLRWSLSWPLYP